jgi:hypothetical protein
MMEILTQQILVTYGFMARDKLKGQNFQLLFQPGDILFPLPSELVFLSTSTNYFDGSVKLLEKGKNIVCARL